MNRERVPDWTGIAVRILGLHGLALVGSTFPTDASSTTLVVVALGVASLPWALWCLGPDWARSRAEFAYGIVPGALLVGSAIAESGRATPVDAFDALRIAAGVVAQIAAVTLLDRPLERPAEVEMPSRAPGSVSDPERRSRARAVLFVATAVGLVAITTLAPYRRAGATPGDRTFAAVCGAVLAATLVLTALPVAVRRERAARLSVRGRVVAALALAAVALATTALEAYTRGR